jgi:hypothetical protein
LKQLAAAGSSIPLPEIPERQGEVEKPEIRSGRVLVSALNVRNKPNSTGKVIGILRRGEVVAIHAILNTYWADLGDNRYAAIKGKTGTYIEFFETPLQASEARLGFFPMRRKVEKFLEGVFFRQIKKP